ncbi:MAG: helix-turn-helix domain-containing protein [Planctomycetes bacterium]|nr:helix-turn-helix domain-containing protein [Planctomycetota bacterium]
MNQPSSRKIYEGSRVIEWPSKDTPRGQLMAGHKTNSPDYEYRAPQGVPYWDLIYLSDGAVHLRANGAQHRFNAPCLLLIKPDTPYEMSGAIADEPWSEYWAVFSARRHWHGLLEWPAILPGIMALRLGDPKPKRRIKTAFAQAVRLQHCKLGAAVHPYREDFAMNALERVLLLTSCVNPDVKRPAIDSRIQQAVQYLNDHLADPISVEGVAKAVHLSPSHLAHLFRQEIRESLKRYLERRRIERSRELLLQTDAPINQVAKEVGFDNPLHFSTRFRRYSGQSPRDYRLHNKAD